MAENVPKCCNPFRRPHRSFLQLFKVNQEIVNRSRDIKKRVVATDMICANCRQKIHNEWIKEQSKSKPSTSKVQPELPQMIDLDETIGAPSASEEKTDESETKTDFDTERIKHVKRCVNALLKALDLSEMDEDKIRGKKYQNSMLNGMIERLNNVLFKEDSPLDTGNKIIEQLKEKFNEQSTDRSMKMKILSVLPKEWSALEVQRTFSIYFRISIHFSHNQ